MDSVFFLTHQELGQLVRDQKPEWGELALARRAIHADQDALRFPDVFAGVPDPIDPHAGIRDGSRMVKGSSVSRGRVVAPARVVHTAAEAEALEEGEILIAPITDVGWTPYFNLISGLVTDIGSAVSHGAVVAREYGLPAVVNTQIGTQVFQTGDRIVLDADHGVVRLAEEDE
jgi:pyruvate,water dikinase